MNQTLYDVLGVPPDVLQQGIRKAYQREALRWHPDKNAGDTIAKERFQTIQKAYSTLFNEAERRLYDKDLALQHKQHIHPVPQTHMAQSSHSYHRGFDEPGIRHFSSETAYYQAANLNSQVPNRSYRQRPPDPWKSHSSHRHTWHGQTSPSNEDKRTPFGNPWSYPNHGPQPDHDNHWTHQDGKAFYTEAQRYAARIAKANQGRQTQERLFNIQRLERHLLALKAELKKLNDAERNYLHHSHNTRPRSSQRQPHSQWSRKQTNRFPHRRGLINAMIQGATNDLGRAKIAHHEILQREKVDSMLAGFATTAERPWRETAGYPIPVSERKERQPPRNQRPARASIVRNPPMQIYQIFHFHNNNNNDKDKDDEYDDEDDDDDADSSSISSSSDNDEIPSDISSSAYSAYASSGRSARKKFSSPPSSWNDDEVLTGRWNGCGAGGKPPWQQGMKRTRPRARARSSGHERAWFHGWRS